MRLFEIYFNDLNDEAKKNYMKFRGVEDESELNHEYCPLAVMENEMLEDDK